MKLVQSSIGKILSLSLTAAFVLGFVAIQPEANAAHSVLHLKGHVDQQIQAKLHLQFMNGKSHTSCMLVGILPFCQEIAESVGGEVNLSPDSSGNFDVSVQEPSGDTLASAQLVVRQDGKEATALTLYGSSNPNILQISKVLVLPSAAGASIRGLTLSEDGREIAEATFDETQETTVNFNIQAVDSFDDSQQFNPNKPFVQMTGQIDAGISAEFVLNFRDQISQKLMQKSYPLVVDPTTQKDQYGVQIHRFSLSPVNNIIDTGKEYYVPESASISVHRQGKSGSIQFATFMDGLKEAPDAWNLEGLGSLNLYASEATPNYKNLVIQTFRQHSFGIPLFAPVRANFDIFWGNPRFPN